MSLMLSLFEYKAWANEELFTALRAVDAVEHAQDMHAAIRILNHVYVVDQIFVANLSKVPHGYNATNTVETPTLEALKTNVSITDDWYLNYVAQIKPEDLAEQVEFIFTDGDHGRMTREEILMHVITHGGYHRGAVGRILAQISIGPPRDILTRFLHQSDPTRRVVL